MGVTPIAGWFTMENPNIKWMIWGVLSHGGTPIAGWIVDFRKNSKIKWMMTGGTAPQF